MDWPGRKGKREYGGPPGGKKHLSGGLGTGISACMTTKSVRILMVVALLGVSMFLAGCVERELTITSEPSGALVYVSNVEVGRTPVKVPFTWYGDYEIVLRMPEPVNGVQYDTLKTNTPICPPIYDIPPWDLISQALVPWTYHYQVTRNYVLKPYEPPTDQQLLNNALQLQQRNLESVQK